MDARTAPALLRLMPYVWGQDWDADFLRQTFRWRYADKRPDEGTWLAFDHDECVAVIDSYIRLYLLDFRRVLVRETADWFSLPK